MAESAGKAYTMDGFALRNYLKIIMKVHKERLTNFERIIAMIS